jgi:hypothetical protein
MAMATSGSRHGINALPAVRLEIARGVFQACQRDAHGALARLDPFLMTGEAVPHDLEQQMRGAQAKLTEAKTNLDAAKMAAVGLCKLHPSAWFQTLEPTRSTYSYKVKNWFQSLLSKLQLVRYTADACAEIEARAAAVKLVADAPQNAVACVAQRQQLAVEHTRISHREDDLAIERVALLRERAALEEANSKEKARASWLQRELLETQAYKRRLEQDLARQTEQIVVAERRAATAELSMVGARPCTVECS